MIMPDIDFQKIILNLIPKREEQPVVFYASQYETTRPFIADLFWGDTEFAPGDDCWAEIDIRKNDDNLVVITDDVAIDNNEVSVILPVQAVTCIGKNLGQIKIYAGEGQFVAAFNFILEVQADPLAGGVTSETAIDNLTQQIEDITQEVIGEDYYNKTETDALLADKADKSELPDMNDYYTKTATDALLADKADVSDIPDMTNYYTKSETNGLISTLANQVNNKFVDIMPVGNAVGNPCTFDTEYPYIIQGLTAEIVASGGGGSPSTPIPIVGYSEINLDVNGDTFTVAFGQTVYGGVYDKSGRLMITHAKRHVTSSDDLYSSATGTNFHQFISQGFTDAKNSNNAICDKLKTIEISERETETGMISYSSDTIFRFSFLNNTGITTLQDFKDWLDSIDGLDVVYELATPIVIDVRSLNFATEDGTNTITSDCIGDVTAYFKDSIQHYIDTRL